MEQTSSNSHKQDVIKIDLIDTSIAQIRMEDEAGKNSLSPEFVSVLEQKIESVVRNEAVKAIVLTGLPSVFCAGADFDTLKQLSTGSVKPVDILLPKKLLDVPIPLISAMEGHATGGGLALGLCGDIVILAEESRYGCSFMNMGFTPGMGITRMLEDFMSPALAREMLYTGTFKKGKELTGKTYFNDILPKAEVLPRAIGIAQAIAEKPKQSLVILKRYLSLRRRSLFEETLTIESMMHDISFTNNKILQQIEENYVGK